MVQIDRLTPEHLPAAGAVLDVAFRRTGMVSRLSTTYELQPESWFAAWRDGTLVGLVGAHDYGPVASVGMMGVHPSYQRQGIGLALMRRLVDFLDARHCPLVFLEASADGRFLYPALDFAVDGETLRMELVQPTRRAAPEPESAFRLMALSQADLPEVVTFDAGVFGADRSSVLAAHLQVCAGRSFVVRDPSDAIAGYIMADLRHIGPWAAISPTTAEILLSATMALPFAGRPFVACPGGNPAVRPMLSGHGFVQTEQLLHMRRGGPADQRQLEQYYSLASLALG